MIYYKNIIFISIALYCANLSAQSVPYFDSGKAFEYINKQCEFGPRYPGSEGHKTFSIFLNDFLANKSDTLITYKHEVKHPYKDKDEIHLLSLCQQRTLLNN